MIKRLCQKIAAPAIWICILLVLGIVGKIENGGSLSLVWWASGALGVTFLILMGASESK